MAMHGNGILTDWSPMPIPLPSRIARRVADTLSLLLAPGTYAESARWREDVARDLRRLVGAEAALIAVEDTSSCSLRAIDLDDGIVRAYQGHYASVDVGIARQRSLGIEVWCRRRLWGASELSRSEYFNDFARPHRLLDAFGMGTSRGTQRVRIALMCDRSSAPRKTAHRLGLLHIVLPAFRAGMAVSAGADRWSGSACGIIDGVDQALMLCDESGRELHHNCALERAAAVLGDRLLGAIEDVKRTMVSRRPSATGEGGDVCVALPATSGEWKIHGWRLPLTVDGSISSSRILISLARRDRALLPSSEQRTRFGLTKRETEVVELLRRRQSNAEIARALRVSEHTARHHTERILQKLGLHSRNDVDHRLRTDAVREGTPSLALD